MRGLEIRPTRQTNFVPAYVTAVVTLQMPNNSECGELLIQRL